MSPLYSSYSLQDTQYSTSAETLSLLGTKSRTVTAVRKEE
jgi:hypothetical protein